MVQRFPRWCQKKAARNFVTFTIPVILIVHQLLVSSAASFCYYSNISSNDNSTDVGRIVTAQTATFSCKYHGFVDFLILTHATGHPNVALVFFSDIPSLGH
jgi:hypothetical protein